MDRTLGEYTAAMVTVKLWSYLMYLENLWIYQVSAATGLIDVEVSLGWLSKKQVWQMPTMRQFWADLSSYFTRIF